MSSSSNTKVPFSKSNDEVQDKLLLQPMLYLLQIPGKNVRKKLLSAFNVWTRVEDDKVRQIGELVQMLHNASLLLDDIGKTNTQKNNKMCHCINSELKKEKIVQ